MAELITQVSQSQARSFPKKKKDPLKLLKKPVISLPFPSTEPERNQYGINSPRGFDNTSSTDSAEEAKDISVINHPTNESPQQSGSDHPSSQELGSPISSLETNFSQIIISEENNEKSSENIQSIEQQPIQKPTTVESQSLPPVDEQPLSSPAPSPPQEPEPEPEPILMAPWTPHELLPPQTTKRKGKKCLILDLDETLVHSSFHSGVEYHFEIPVDIEGIVRTIYVAKRPHVDDFMKVCGELFEVVVFTASLAKYADPLLDLLDIHKVIDHRLFRESCTPHNGIFVKDLFRIGRPLNQIIIIDNSPHSYAFNPQNAIPCESWFDDKSDNELLVLLEILRRIADSSVEDVIKEMETLEVSASCSSLGYPFEPEVVPLPEPVNEENEEDGMGNMTVVAENEVGDDPIQVVDENQQGDTTTCHWKIT